MELDGLSLQMTGNAERVRAVVQDVSDRQARWRPNATSWSILEVVNHLYDEERQDFRLRLDHILRGRTDRWPDIDPQGWVTERAYNERELGESLGNYLAAREGSLAWLRGLSAPDWEATYEAPFGTIRAGDVMAAWVVHDLKHLRQLVRLHGAYTVQALQPYQVRYAGGAVFY
jgi:hypothetical protein